MGGRGGSSGLSGGRSGKPSFEIDPKGFTPEFLKEMTKILTDLDSTYENYVYKVEHHRGGFSGEGGSMNQGGLMEIQVKDITIPIHEFAHGIATTRRDDNGLSNNKEFWKEISRIRTRYRKAVENSRENSIGSYANSGGGKGRDNLNEFMAEGFTMSYAHRHGIKLNSSQYKVTPSSLKWADEIRSTVDKYFKKKR